MRNRVITILAVVVVVLGTSGIAYIYYDEWRGELGFIDAREAYDDGNHRSAFNLFHRLARAGHFEAQRYLAHMYEHGEGTDTDMFEAFDWRIRLADRGDLASMYWVAWSYEKGRGTVVNHDGAIRWYRRAARQGDVDSQAALGAKLVFGNGVAADPDQGLMWLRRAVDEGNAWAMAMLGRALNEGRLGKPDNPQALNWCLQSIKGGNFAGCKCTLDLLGNDKLPTFDLEQAYVWALVARHWWRAEDDKVSWLDAEIRGILRHRPVFSGRRTSSIVGATELRDGTPVPADRSESWLEFEMRYRDFESWPIRLQGRARSRAETTAEDILARWPEPPIIEN